LEFGIWDFDKRA